MFFGIKGCLLLDFKQCNDKINTLVYSQMIQNLHTQIDTKCLEKLTDSITLLYDSACSM
jgi:hypothetical protein